MPDAATTPTSLPSPWAGLLSLTRREVVRFLRQPARVAAAIGTPLILWVFLGSGFASTQVADLPYAKHLLPGMVSLSVVFSSIFAAISLIEDRNSGFLQGVLVSPLPRWALAASKVLGGSIIAASQGAILLLGAYTIGMRPGAAGLMQALGAIACSAVLVNALSLSLAWRIESVQGFHGVMNMLLMPMWLLGGTIFPVSGASGWLRTIMFADPLLWTNQALLQSLTPQPPVFPASTTVVWLVCVGLALAALALSWLTIGSRPRHA
jgi:ABC-2 type transport system permease protein